MPWLLLTGYSLVFVHGLTGGFLETWSIPQGSAEAPLCWPRDILPDRLKGVRIMSFSYDADVTRFLGRTSSNGLLEHAGNLLERLKLRRQGADEVRMSSKWKSRF
jgi:streptomycin 6-kinase